MPDGELPLDCGWRGPAEEGEGIAPDSPTPSGTILRILLGDTRSGEESGADGDMNEPAPEESPRTRALREQFAHHNLYDHR